MDQSVADLPTEPVELPYRYQFEADEWPAIKACVREHGFAVMKRAIPLELVEELQQQVRDVVFPKDDLKPGDVRFKHAFMEYAPAMIKLIDDERFRAFSAFMFETEELTLHRSASIVRAPGGNGMAWHTDMSHYDGPPRGIDDILNKDHRHFSGPFYLTGSNPTEGGLAIIPDSHHMDWPGPEGFAFTENRKSFYRKGAEPVGHHGMDVPGAIPLITEPGDRALFASNTYHGVYPHRGTKVRLSCGVGFRPKFPKIVPNWELTDSAKRFIASLPKHLERYYEDYIGAAPEAHAEY